MTKTAELFDGTRLEFPDAASDEVITRVVKAQTAERKAAAASEDVSAKDVAGEAGRIGAKGAIGAVAGLPALAGDYLRDAAIGPVNTAARLIGAQEPFEVGMPASNAVSRASEAAAGAIAPAPTSGAGRVGEALATGAIEALGGSGLFKVGAKIFQSLPEAAAFLQSMAAAPKTNAAYSAAASGGGEAAQEAGLPPIVGTVAGLAGAAAGHAGYRGARAAPGAVKGAVDDALVRTPEAQETAAAARLRASASDPAALDDWARRGETGELVPGSKPTLFESVDDTGIGAAQRRAATDDTGGYRGAIEERRGEQNAARLAEIESLGGEGRVTATLDEFRRQRDALDQAHGFREGVAQSEADVAAGRAGTAATPEEVGRGIREPMSAAAATAKAEAGKLYDAIAAEGVTVGTGRIKAAVGKHFSATPEKPLSAEEKYFADLVRGYSGRLDFGRLQDLRSEVVARGSNYQLGDNVRRRFVELKRAIDQAMDDGLQRAIQDDASLFQRAAAAAGSHGRDDLAASARAASGGIPAGTVAPEIGGTRPPVGGFRADAGGAGVSPGEGVAAPAARLNEAPAAPAAAPNVPIDDALTGQQRAANAAWRQYKQTYGAEPVLKKGPNAGFAMTEAKIPDASFKPGNAGGERIRAMRAAGATDEALSEAAALSLQQSVIRDGAVDPTAFRRWLNNHATAIAELPEGVRRGFNSAADAAATVERVMAERRTALKDFDRTAVGKVLGVPEADLERAIKGYLETPSKAHELANAVSNNPAAKAGLQRLTADFITRQFTSASDDISKASLTGWLKKNKAAMAAVFGNEGAQRFQRLADDIERSRKQMVTGKDPSGPGTAGDLASVAKSAAGATVMSLIAKALGPKGIAAAGLGKAILGNMKLAGIADVDQLFARALIDPELARKLLTKAPAVKNAKFTKGLGASILRSASLGAAYGGQ